MRRVGITRLPPVEGRAVRVNVTLDEILLGEVDRATAAEQMNRSNFLARAARAFLDRRHGDATATSVALRKALCDSRPIHPSHSRGRPPHRRRSSHRPFGPV